MAVRVLVIDDSAFARQWIGGILSEDPDIEVVGSAADPYIARQMIKDLAPDVLTLDVEMPRMDGLKFLGNLMRLRPMPVVMVSAQTRDGAEAALAAMELGAVDFVGKPGHGGNPPAGFARILVDKVKAAADVKPRPAQRPVPPQASVDRPAAGLIALGASTGGTEALRLLLSRMPVDAPPIVVAQHIPAGFSAAFAERLDRGSAVRVVEAVNGALLCRGHVHVAPGGRQLEVLRAGGRWQCRVREGDPDAQYRPSVDVLFASVARAAGRSAVAALLTGMGSDGARGLLAMRDAGAMTFAQDRDSSVVWGMPGAAVKLGAARHVVSLDALAGRLLEVAVPAPRAGHGG